MGLFGKEKGEETLLKVEGMSCQHCVGKVQKGLSALEGVQEVAVDLERKEVRVRHDPAKVGVDALRAKIGEIGYQVV